MKKIIPIILITCALVVSGQQKTFTIYNTFLTDKEYEPKVVSTGDTAQFYFQFPLSEMPEPKANMNEVYFRVILNNYDNNKLIDSTKFIRGDSLPLGTIDPYKNKYVLKMVLPVIYDSTKVIDRFSIRIHAKVLNNTIRGLGSINIIYFNNAINVGILDYTVDQTLGEPLYYIDLNGRQLTEPKGMAIAVYDNGRRRKVLFE